ncbi:uncharacterized protein LOC143458676 isoform X1 [Clavelina lepadiformis]|uniref:uncharacterized protein LOC143458676 isoform X1 n=1 Tax=Clavelina lepadiformis TaxID=159417 RepID=UPI00404138E8
MELPYPVLPQPSSSKNEDTKKKPSFRFELSLKTTEDAGCPEFSYTELMRDILKKKKIRKKEINEKDPVMNEDLKERADAESMARYFEEKYGGGGKKTGSRKRRRDRVEDLADVGYGYDETDPFVDNSECYDEVVPASLTTQFGGFYINSGKLEFKQVSDDSNVDVDDSEEDEDSLPLSAHLKKKRKKDLFNDSDDNDFRDSNGLSTKKKAKLKKRKGSSDVDEKRHRKLSLQGKDKLGKLSKGPKKKQTKVQLLVAKAKAQHHMNTADKLGASKHGHNSNRSMSNGTTTTPHDTGEDLLDFLDDQTEKDKEDILDIFDSDPLSSSDDPNRSKLRLSSFSDDLRKLPHSLPTGIKDKINSLTKIAKSNENEGKVKFFSPDVNHLLLGIEVGSQTLSSRERSGIYKHITTHVPCSKDTLIKRMKKLHASKQDEALRRPLELLKDAIDEVMCEQMKRYDEECAAQHLAKMDDRVALAASTDEDDDGTGLTPGGEEKTKRIYAPRRKFKWTDKIRLLLFDVVKVKVRQFETLKNRSSHSAEEYLKNFLEMEVKNLWPKGWMQARMLFKESREIHQVITGSQAKQKKVVLSGSRRIAVTKVEKKPTLSSQMLAGLISNTPTPFTQPDGGRVSKQLFKDSSMSLNLNLDSSAAPEKQNDLMNKAITSAQKEISLNKVSQMKEFSLKNPTVVLHEQPHLKSLSLHKDTPSAKPQNKKEPSHSDSFSLFKMLDMGKPRSQAKSAGDSAQKTLKVWHEAGSVEDDNSATIKSSSHKSSPKEVTPQHSGTSSRANTNVASKSQAKKSFSKTATNSSQNISSLNTSHLDQYSAELFKLAMMTPAGGGHFPPVPYQPGILPGMTSMEDFANFMQQQNSLHSQMQPTSNSFPLYFAGLTSSTTTLPSQSQAGSKQAKAKPKTPVTAVKTSTSKTISRHAPGLTRHSPELVQKQQKSHNSHSDPHKSPSSHHFKSSLSTTDHTKKSSQSSVGTHQKFTTGKNSMSAYKDNSSHGLSKSAGLMSAPIGRAPSSLATGTLQSSTSKGSTSKTVNSSPYSYSPSSSSYSPASSKFSVDSITGVMPLSSPLTPAHKKYDTVAPRQTFALERSPYTLPKATTIANNAQRDKAAMEALLSVKNQMQPACFKSTCTGTRR